MLVLDFKVDYRLKNTQRYFCGMHGMSQRGCIEKNKGHLGVGPFKSVLVPTCLILSTSFMYSMMI